MRKVLIAGACLAAACTGNDAPASVAQVEAQTAAPGFVSRDWGATTLPVETTTTAEVTTTTVVEVVEVTTTHYHAPVTTTTLLRGAPLAKEQTVLDYGEWAIPRYIVACETGGTFDWYAYNSSGASGPYQLMPMHFDGELAMNQSRSAQHAKAAELWDGGKGKSHWSECL